MAVSSTERMRAWRRANPERANATARAASKRYRLKNPDKTRAARYGIEAKAYALRHSQQNGVCAICRSKPKKLVIDHDHRTNEFRGLLCLTCNTGLGMFYDRPDILRLAAAYLEDSSWR